eukprot:3726106-Rhodomonas_salina.3
MRGDAESVRERARGIEGKRARGNEREGRWEGGREGDRGDVDVDAEVHELVDALVVEGVQALSRALQSAPSSPASPPSTLALALHTLGGISLRGQARTRHTHTRSSQTRGGDCQTLLARVPDRGSWD